MTTWYVRPPTYTGGTNAGTSYVNAWQGWSNISWNSLAAGDSLMMCGTHNYTSTVSTGAHNGSLGNPVYIDGSYAYDPCYFNSTGFINTTRSHTVFQYLNMPSGYFYVQTISDVKWFSNRFSQQNSTPIFLAAGAGVTFQGLTIDRNVFNGCTGLTGSGNAGISALIQWYHATASANSSCSQITITNNQFNNCIVSRSLIHFRTVAGVNASSTLADIIVNNNTINGYSGCAIELSVPVAGGFTYTGVQVIGNSFKNGADSPQSAGQAGGIFVGGFSPSLTSGFGPNLVQFNTGNNITGQYGLVDAMNGTYIIQHNVGSNFYSNTIDANGLLLDVNCINSTVRYNQISNVFGKTGVLNSGAGIMNLAGTTSNKIYSNVINGCRIGLYMGGDGTDTGNQFYNNDFLNCSVYGIYAGSSCVKSTVIKNNIFTATSNTVPFVYTNGTDLTGEDYSNYYGFGASGGNGHTAGAHDITTSPQLATDFRPMPGSPVLTAGSTSGYVRDADMKQAKNFIGAYGAGKIRKVTIPAKGALV